MYFFLTHYKISQIRANSAKPTAALELILDRYGPFDVHLTPPRTYRYAVYPSR